MLDKSKPPSLRKTILATSIAVALASSECQARRKLVEVQGLPQTESISLIRSSRDSLGNAVITWLSDNNLYLEQIPLIGRPTAEPSKLVTTQVFDPDLAIKSDGTYLSAWTTTNNAGWGSYRINGLIP